MEKILITGTGRCGTTFLIKLFSFLGFDTGYTRENYNRFISKNCNSGMERQHTENHQVLKNPTFIQNISTILESSIRIKSVIIPVRDLNQSAKSRVRHQKKNGGLWNAVDEKTQVDHYRNILSNYVCLMAKHDIPTVFLDFDRMVTDRLYLFDRLSHLMVGVNFDRFSEVYDEVTVSSRPS